MCQHLPVEQLPFNNELQGVHRDAVPRDGGKFVGQNVY
jgi:hypothetical protein